MLLLPLPLNYYVSNYFLRDTATTAVLQSLLALHCRHRSTASIGCKACILSVVDQLALSLSAGELVLAGDSLHSRARCRAMILIYILDCLVIFQMKLERNFTFSHGQILCQDVLHCELIGLLVRSNSQKLLVALVQSSLADERIVVGNLGGCVLVPESG